MGWFQWKTCGKSSPVPVLAEFSSLAAAVSPPCSSPCFTLLCPHLLGKQPLSHFSNRDWDKQQQNAQRDSLVFCQSGPGPCQSAPAGKDWREPPARVNNEISWSWHSQQRVSAGDLGSCVVFSLGTLLGSPREGSATSPALGQAGIECPVTGG